MGIILDFLKNIDLEPNIFGGKVARLIFRGRIN